MTQIRKLIDHDSIESSEWFQSALKEVLSAIEAVKWPVGSSDFAIYPRRKGNGVGPIKNSFVSHLRQNGWRTEETFAISSSSRPGPIDAVKTTLGGRFAVEWETGNISSSHRALNKMTVGIMKGIIVGGILVLPSRTFYEFLTDRIGNFREIEPYFCMWEAVETKGRGYLGVIEVEHDRMDLSAPPIKKGTDGRALR